MVFLEGAEQLVPRQLAPHKTRPKTTCPIYKVTRTRLVIAHDEKLIIAEFCKQTVVAFT